LGGGRVRDVGLGIGREEKAAEESTKENGDQGTNRVFEGARKEEDLFRRGATDIFYLIMVIRVEKGGAGKRVIWGEGEKDMKNNTTRYSTQKRSCRNRILPLQTGS